jgi:hypothetical protein
MHLMSRQAPGLNRISEKNSVVAVKARPPPAAALAHHRARPDVGGVPVTPGRVWRTIRSARNG